MNPYSEIDDNELERLALAITPNRDLIKRKKEEIFGRAIWKMQNPDPAQLEALRKELNVFFEELIAIQDSLGAAIVTVNRLNREMYTNL